MRNLRLTLLVCVWVFVWMLSGRLTWADMPGKTCEKPAYMLVESNITDRKKLSAYGKALRASNLYPDNQGYYIVFGKPVEVFEGDFPANRTIIVARFPCLERARAFWNSEKYQAIKKLREGAGVFNIQVYEEADLPPYAKRIQ